MYWRLMYRLEGPGAARFTAGTGAWQRPDFLLPASVVGSVDRSRAQSIGEVGRGFGRREWISDYYSQFYRKLFDAVYSFLCDASGPYSALMGIDIWAFSRIAL